MKLWIPPAVERVTMLARDGTVLLYKKGRKRRKIRGDARLILGFARAHNTATSEFLRDYERSCRRKKNGGLKNLKKYLAKAKRKGMKTFRRTVR
ncbi:MAG: hypothetical protein HY815_14890 [Candidatus Riflebacteria bacterium]|nr:hypothetical protein [Candidatus Riflebacteria bacterium]